MFYVFYVIEKVSTANLRTGLISEIYLSSEMIVGLWNSGTPELWNSGIWEVAAKWKNTVLKWKAKSDSKFQVPEAGFQLVMIQYIRSESDLTRGKFQVPSPKAFENGIWNLAVSLARRFNVTDETGETDETGKFQTTKPHPISTPKFQVPALGSAGIWSAMATSRGRSCGLEFRATEVPESISTSPLRRGSSSQH